MNTNPPIPGHALLFEGKTRPPWSAWWDDDEHTVYLGGCECGATPDGFPKVSANATQRWHREHKAHIRRQQP